MDEFMLYNYLRGKGIDNMDEYELTSKLKAFMENYKRDNVIRYEKDDRLFPINSNYSNFHTNKHGRYKEPMYMAGSNRNNNLFGRINNNVSNEDMYDTIGYTGNHVSKDGHFDEATAKYLVANMYHIENGVKCAGEEFDMYKAIETHERYRGILPVSITPIDIYVAINSQYHDYAEIFKNWFGNDIEQKVIESAIVFWFKDVDTKYDNKLMEYFKIY